MVNIEAILKDLDLGNKAALEDTRKYIEKIDTDCDHSIDEAYLSTLAMGFQDGYLAAVSAVSTK